MTTKSQVSFFLCELEDILKQKTKENVLLEYAICLLKETKSQEYTKKCLFEYFNKVQIHIQDLNGNKVLLKIIEELMKKIE
jgi:geranylgeranyl pyrophosphate synthase